MIQRGRCRLWFGGILQHQGHRRLFLRFRVRCRGGRGLHGRWIRLRCRGLRGVLLFSVGFQLVIRNLKKGEGLPVSLHDLVSHFSDVVILGLWCLLVLRDLCGFCVHAHVSPVS